MVDQVDGARIFRMRWVMIGMAFLATVLNYVHRLSFSYLSASGTLRHMITDEAFGYIATAFFVAYMISNALSGFVIDRLGTRIGYSLYMACWTTAAMLHALAVSPFQFGVFRFLLGIGEAGNWPAAIKLTNEWFSPEERSTATGIFNSGGAIGAIIAPVDRVAGRCLWLAGDLCVYRAVGLRLAGRLLVPLLYAGESR